MNKILKLISDNKLKLIGGVITVAGMIVDNMKHDDELSAIKNELKKELMKEMKGEEKRG